MIGYGLLPDWSDSTKSSPEPMLTHHQRFCDDNVFARVTALHLRAISQKVLIYSIGSICLKITFLKLLQGAMSQTYIVMGTMLLSPV